MAGLGKLYLTSRFTITSDAAHSPGLREDMAPTAPCQTSRRSSGKSRAVILRGNNIRPSSTAIPATVRIDLSQSEGQHVICICADMASSKLFNDVFVNEICSVRVVIIVVRRIYPDGGVASCAGGVGLDMQGVPIGNTPVGGPVVHVDDPPGRACDGSILSRGSYGNGLAIVAVWLGLNDAADDVGSRILVGVFFGRGRSVVDGDFILQFWTVVLWGDYFMRHVTREP